MTFRQNIFLQDWFRNKLEVGLVFGIGLVLVKPLLCYVLSLWGQRNNLFRPKSVAKDGGNWRPVPVPFNCFLRGWHEAARNVQKFRVLTLAPVICRAHWVDALSVLAHAPFTSGTCKGRGSISKVEGHRTKVALLYRTKIKRFYVVHEPNENFWKYGVSIMSEMAFTEFLLLQKWHFLSSKRGRSFMKYFFHSLNGTL
jgi:hypothetical protein